MTRLVECVPNFSEGRDRAVIDAIADAIRGVTGVKLLDVDPGADTNRTVYTFVGSPEAVADAAVTSARRAYELIDMSRHTGAHPRIGALDVCPFVPVSGVTMDECAEMARRVGAAIGESLQVPIYFYEHAATSEARRSLAAIRAGEYEGLERKLADQAWLPDAGPARFDARYGASVVGAREFLIAYNVNLNTRDRRLANEIALNIRENGRIARGADGTILVDAQGNQVRTPGRLQAVRAIGWYIEQYRQAQVSINLINYRVTPLHVVFETVREEAARLGLRVTGSELVGLTPLQPMLDAGRHFLQKQGKSAGVPERELVEMAVRSLGLDQLGPFDADRKVIEYQFRPAAPLMSMTVSRFVDEISCDSPAPGGGSVAALAGSLGAALAAMVANLTIGKRGHEADWEPLRALAERGQVVKDRLARAVDEDTEAFNGVIAAMRLPKGTLAEQEARRQALREAYEAASRVPLATAGLCLEAIGLALEAAERGNVSSVSDAGVAALVARAGVEGAGLNVLTNLASIGNERVEAEFRAEVDRLNREASQLTARTIARVTATFAR